MIRADVDPEAASGIPFGASSRTTWSPTRIVNKFLLTAMVWMAVFHGWAGDDAASATNAFEHSIQPAPQAEVDKLVFAQLRKLNIEPRLCSDGVFVRRVYLDVIGTLPTAAEAQQFILDTSADKRRALIDRLLNRPEYADYWAMKWSDVLRIKAEFPVNLWPNAAQAYHRFVKASLSENKPYDEFVREMLTSSGSNFRVGAVNFYRAVQNRTPEGIAGAVALTFMGSRVETWPTNRFQDLTVFFSQIGYKPTSEWKEEHVFWDPLGASKLEGYGAPGRASVVAIANPTNKVAPVTALAPASRMETTFPDGTKVSLSASKDPREVFADWLIRPENKWFAKSLVNRAWSWFLGRGIVHEPDDLREENAPSNPGLLAYLEREFIRSKYDLKALYRLILNSQTYQLSSLPRNLSAEGQAQFASYTLRRLDAEVLSDAINKVTGSSDLYTSPIPEPFTYIPKGMPAVSIADGSITSPFLALFGRSARATGLENERNNKPTSAQALYLLNSSDIQAKLEQGTNLNALISGARKSAVDIANELYLTILSRYPTPEELTAVEEYRAPLPARTPPRRAQIAASSATNTSSAITSSSGRKGRPLGSLGPVGRAAARAAAQKQREDWIDIAWSLINSEEFLYRH